MNGKLATNDQHFDLVKILDSAQDFRWRCWNDEEGYFWYSGVLAGNLIHIRQVEDQLEYSANSNLDSLLTDYFLLDQDLEAVRAELSTSDDRIAVLVEKYPYLRILRQPDPWECTVSYICSAVTKVGETKKRVKRIAVAFGQEIDLNGDKRHAFPRPEDVIGVNEERLRSLNLGTGRNKDCIVAVAEAICDGKLDLHHLARQEASYDKAIGELRDFRGIAQKISNCVALFALGKSEAFPVDTHIMDAVRRHYSTDLGEVKDGDQDRIARWAQRVFGQHAGLANQLLFQEQWDPQ